MHEFSSVGQPIFSPEAGRVVSCSSKSHDFLPTPDRTSFHGKTENLKKNYRQSCVDENKKDQYLLLGHMRKNSICVRCGEDAIKGQKLGHLKSSSYQEI
jgi:hypothetical protein